MRRRYATGILAVVAMASVFLTGRVSAEPRDLYVSTNATVSGSPWNSWSTAFTNIQDAIDAADPGDAIYVAGHVFPMSAQISISSKDNLTIIGGFEAANDTQQPGMPDPVQWPTVLQRIGSPNFHSTPRFRFFDVSGVTGFVLDGVTMTGGFPAIGEHGGALRVANSSGVEIHNCIFDSNLVYIYNGTSRGGAIHASNTSGIISNTVFSGNGSFNGYAASSQHAEAGALYVSGGTWEIRDSEFRGNRVHKVVGTAYGSGGTGLFETYINRGGAVLVNGGTHVMHNVAFAANAAVGSGSAIRVENAATTLSLVNVTASGNTGGEALHVATGTVAVTNSIFWHNERDITGGGTVTLAYSNTEDGFDAGNNGNISADPRFERGLYLGAGSASTNAGTGTAADWGLAARTTRADGSAPSGTVDQGYHFASGLDPAVADLYVAPGGDNGNSGTSWGSALASVTYALSLARDGTRIHLAAGNYTNSATAEQFPLVIDRKWGIQLLGAGAGETTLAVVGGTRVRLLNLAHTAGDTRIDGIRFTGGYPANNNDGGAVRIDYGHVAFTGCLFQGNQAQNTINRNLPLGGALYAHEARVNLSDTHFEGNRAFNSYGAADSGRSRGGAAYFFRGRSQIDRARLIGNISNKSRFENLGSQGGALFYFRGQHEIYNALVVSNTASGVGSAIAADNAVLSLNNLTVADNTNTVALHVTGDGVSVTNSIFRNNAGGDFDNASLNAVWYSCATGLTHGVQGNISDDPLLIGGGDYRLQTSISPAIDAGVNHDWMQDAYDLAGTNRIMRGRKSLTVDMGAYETLAPEDAGLDIMALSAINVVGDSATARALLLGTGDADNPEVVVCWGAVDGGTSGTGAWARADALGAGWDAPGEIAHVLSPLDPGQDYVYRFYATNSTGHDWSEKIEFTTVGYQEVVNDGVEWVRYRQAFVKGSLLDDGGEPVTVWLEYWPDGGSSTSTVMIGSVAEAESFDAVIDGLDMDASYSFHWAASNVVMTAFSDQESFTTLFADPVVWYVATNGLETAATNWNSAFQSVQAAMAVAEAGDVIYLAGQTFPMTQTIEWTASDVTIIGGYEPGGGLPGVPDPDNWPTVLLRNVSDRFRILNINGLSGGVISNVTFSGGYPVDGQHGGGVQVTDSSVTFANCEISDNRVYIYNGNIYGGGLYAVDSTVMMTDCLVAGNQSINGYGATSQLSHGGGLVFNGGESALSNTVIRANLARKSSHETYLNRGGGIVYLSGSHRVHNAAIAGNVASGVGSGIWVGNAATTLIIENTTLTGNTGGQALHVEAGTVAITNSVLWFNEGDIGGVATLAFSNTEDGYDAGNNGNISSDPLFKRGLYLGDGSPSRNAGVGAAAEWGLDGLTTRSDGAPDDGVVDQGYHYGAGVNAATADFYIAVNGSDVASGTNWNEAFRSITHALSLARDGTRIHIAAGLYTNDVAGGEQFPLVITDRWGVQLLGAGADETVLRVERGVRVRLLDLSYTAGDTLISGLTVTRGYPPDGQFGGGAMIVYGEVLMQDCAFIDNESYVYSSPGPYGGGLYAQEARLRMSECRFEFNRARNGYASTGGGRGDGGGLYLRRGRSHIERSTWIGNRAYKSTHENYNSIGGAVAINDGWHQIASSLMVSNEASGTGAALHLAGADVALVNLTVADSIAVAAMRGSAGAAVTNSIFWNNAGGDFDNIAVDAFHYSLSTGLTHSVQGNITDDPLFVGAGDYRLQPVVSSAIDAGLNFGWMTGATDLAGSKRILFGRMSATVDMGAYETPPVPGSMFMFR